MTYEQISEMTQKELITLAGLIDAITPNAAKEIQLCEESILEDAIEDLYITIPMSYFHWVAGKATLSGTCYVTRMFDRPLRVEIIFGFGGKFKRTFVDSVPFVGY